MTIKAFIFDMDGVIIDTIDLHYQSWKRVTDAEGIPFTRADNEHVRGLTRRDSLERILGERSNNVDEATKQAWMARKNEHFLASLADLSADDAMPGVVPFLKAARATGYRLGVGSSSRNARVVLETLGITALFDAIGDGYSVVNPKPAPDLFLWVAGALGVSPAETVIFEDAAAGVQAAMSGGFQVVGTGTADLSGAHCVIDGLHGIDPAAIIARLEQNRAARGGA